MKNYNYKPITLTALILISSCAKEDDIQYITETITETEYITVTETQVVEIPVTTTVTQTVTVEIPYSYEYEELENLQFLILDKLLDLKWLMNFMQL